MQKRYEELLDLLPAFIIGLFTFAYLAIGFAKYQQFQTSLDLAGYAQALFHLSHGQLPFNSFKGYVMWGDHAHFILIVLAPLYRLLPDPRLLITVQTLVITSAGWALYTTARDTIKDRVFPLALLYAYLSFIGIQYALSLDFHSTVLTGGLLIWILYTAHFKKWYLYWPLLIAALTTREDAPTIFFMVGIWFLCKRQWKLGIFTSLLSAIYFLVVAYVVMPIWTPEQAVLTYLDFPDKDPYHIIRLIVLYPLVLLQNMVDTPQKVETLHTLAQSFGYLSLLSPFTYLASAPILFARFLSPNDYRWLITNHSNANILPVLAWGALLGATFVLSLFKKSNKPRLGSIASLIMSGLLLLSVQITAWYTIDSPLQGLFNSETHTTKEHLEHYQALERIKETIPPQEEIAASGGFLAHLANRSRLVSYPDTTDQTRWIIISSRVNPWPLNRDKTDHAIKQLQKDPAWHLLTSTNDIWVFQRVNR